MQNHQTTPAPQPTSNEEPRITQEEAVPSDGKDTKGEQMMEELGRSKPGPALDKATPAKPS